LTLLFLPLIFERWGALGSLAEVWSHIRQPQTHNRSAS
jgi:hypothetical protein